MQDSKQTSLNGGDVLHLDTAPVNLEQLGSRHEPLTGCAGLSGQRRRGDSPEPCPSSSRGFLALCSAALAHRTPGTCPCTREAEIVCGTHQNTGFCLPIVFRQTSKPPRSERRGSRGSALPLTQLACLAPRWRQFYRRAALCSSCIERARANCRRALGCPITALPVQLYSVLYDSVLHCTSTRLYRMVQLYRTDSCLYYTFEFN
jgi:hypothetical protein